MKQIVLNYQKMVEQRRKEVMPQVGENERLALAVPRAHVRDLIKKYDKATGDSGVSQKKVSAAGTISGYDVCIGAGDAPVREDGPYGTTRKTAADAVGNASGNNADEPTNDASGDAADESRDTSDDEESYFSFDDKADSNAGSSEDPKLYSFVPGNNVSEATNEAYGHAAKFIAYGARAVVAVGSAALAMTRATIKAGAKAAAAAAAAAVLVDTDASIGAANSGIVRATATAAAGSLTGAFVRAATAAHYDATSTRNFISNEDGEVTSDPTCPYVESYLQWKASLSHIKRNGEAGKEYRIFTYNRLNANVVKVPEMEDRITYESMTKISKTDNGIRIMVDIFTTEKEQSKLENILQKFVVIEIPQSRIINEFQRVQANSNGNRSGTSGGRNI